MKLKDWLETEGLKPGEFARRIGCAPETVRRYAAGERIPDKDAMPRIFEETRGEVTANDFFGIAADAPARPRHCSDCDAHGGAIDLCTDVGCTMRAKEAA